MMLTSTLFFAAMLTAVGQESHRPDSLESSGRIEHASEEEKLKALNSRWLNAYPSRDRAALDSVLADDFIGVYGESRLSKEQMLDGLSARRIKSVTWDDLRITVNSNTAVVTAISTIVNETNRGRASARYRYADVYAKRGAEWRAIASHVIKLPD